MWAGTEARGGGLQFNSKTLSAPTSRCSMMRSSRALRDPEVYMRFFRLAFVLHILFISFVADASPRRLTVLHFNDFHGHFEGDDIRGESMGGAARIAVLLSRLKKKNEARGWDTIVLFGGDAFTGSLISAENKGRAEFDFFNMLGVDAFVPGNHEFDFGTPRLQELISDAKFPIVSANIYWKGSSKALASPWEIIGHDGFDVGVIGLTMSDTPRRTLPSNVSDLKFKDEVRQAKKAMRKVRRLSDLRILLTHDGVAKDVLLAKKVRGLAAVVGGHDHVGPDEYCRIVRETPVCQTPPYGHYIGRLDFEVEGEDARYLGSELIPVTGMVGRDPRVARMVAKYSKGIGGKYGRVLGRAEADLCCERGKESRLGYLISDALREHTGSEIAFVNSGGIRAPLRRGLIRMMDVASILPFRNHVVVFKIKGSVLERVVKHSLAQGGGFLQLAGVTYGVEGGKPVDIQVNGKPLERRRIYTGASNEFLMSGGDGYEMLKKIKDREMLAEIVMDAFAKYIESRRVISP